MPRWRPAYRPVVVSPASPVSLLPLIMPAPGLKVVEMGEEGLSDLYFVWRRHQLSDELQTILILAHPA